MNISATNIRRALILVSLIAPAGAFSAEPRPEDKPELREGDLVFIQSMTAQAPALREVMGSSWTHVGIAVRKDSSWFVAETAATVSLTPLPKFLDKSSGRSFLVKRFKPWNARPNKKSRAALKKWLLAGLGKKYDVYFEWSDAAFYCSEYVWKAYNNAVAGHPVLSKPQKFSDLRASGPLAKELIDKRYNSIAKKLNMDEPIVTPTALLNSDLLQTVPQ
jgi:hypothetical protein